MRRLQKPTRRDILKFGGMALAVTAAEQIGWPKVTSAAPQALPRRTARNCIFIELPGAISPMECWDLKETRETPKDLDIRKVTSDLYLSKTLFPNYEAWAPRTTFVRSMRAPELAHFTGQYHTQTGRSLNQAVAKEIPAFGSVVAAELENERRETDSFPTYMSMGLGRARVGAIGAGFFPAQFTGIDLDPVSAFTSFATKPDEAANDALIQRYDALMKLSEVSPVMRASLGDKASDYKAFYKNAYRILDDPRWKRVFEVSEEEKKRYSNGFGMGCILAKNLLAADSGTRLVYVIDGRQPWDHHSYIFDRTKKSNHYVTCLEWDNAFSNLILDLDSTPGHEPGKSLLDETLVVAASEFGRMPYMNNVEGRDHYGETFTTLFIGGGVKKESHIIGATNEDCSKCIDTGWGNYEQPAMDNVIATVYSALGIDWTKTMENTPSGRAYNYVQTAPIGGGEFLSGDAIDAIFE